VRNRSTFAILVIAAVLPAGRLSPEEYDRWSGDWYKNHAPEPCTAATEPD
jgi:hypothetical protein